MVDGPEYALVRKSDILLVLRAADDMRPYSSAEWRARQRLEGSVRVEGTEIVPRTCMLIGANGENSDDCTTHEHED